MPTIHNYGTTMMTKSIEKTLTFSHGVHPEEYKETRHLALERMPFVGEYVLPLSQNLGSPSRPVVKPGQKVRRGEVIAEPTGFVSSYLHAPVTGVVQALALHDHPSGRAADAIVIEADPHSLQTLSAEVPRRENLSAKELLGIVHKGGFVGMGGAAFPTHVKLSVPEGKKAEFFIVNGCECEPYLTCDHRIMLENCESMFLGLRICLAILGAKKAYIGIENNKLDAVETMRRLMPQDLPCEVIALQVKYPQGAEKMLITAVLGKEVPSGKLPIDTHTIVHNVGTMAAIGDLFRFGQPLIERPLTITGPGITRPANLIVPIGTKLKDVIAYCGGLTPDAKQVLMGGPMMGAAQKNLDVPVLKGTSGILCLTSREWEPRKEYQCIRCSRCIGACPVFLNPSQLGKLARKKQYSAMLPLHLMDCIECGCCAYTCPSNIPLVQRFRIAKAILREQQARERAKS